MASSRKNISICLSTHLYEMIAQWSIYVTSSRGFEMSWYFMIILWFLSMAAYMIWYIKYVCVRVFNHFCWVFGVQCWLFFPTGCNLYTRCSWWCMRSSYHQLLVAAVRVCKYLDCKHHMKNIIVACCIHCILDAAKVDSDSRCEYRISMRSITLIIAPLVSPSCQGKDPNVLYTVQQVDLMSCLAECNWDLRKLCEQNEFSQSSIHFHRIITVFPQSLCTFRHGFVVGQIWCHSALQFVLLFFFFRNQKLSEFASSASSIFIGDFPAQDVGRV